MKRKINEWWGRLLGAVADGSLSGQEAMYASHQTTRDYVCNTLGTAAWGMFFPVLTVVITQIVGVELAGMFSLAFVTGTLLRIIAMYGVRTYQVSDIEEQHSFSEYVLNRCVMCAIMLGAGALYCLVRGYGEQMLAISIGVYLFKMIDGLADVYEGRLQQKDKLYLAGLSQAARCVLSLVVFTLLLLITRDLGVASIAMAVASLVTLVMLTIPLALFETPKSRKVDPASLVELFKQCFPLFLALFLYTLIDNMPKFVMEGVLSYDNQLYFNAMYFPAQFILLLVGLIYKPLLVRMANEWADPARRKRFDIAIVAMLGIVVAITAGTVLIMAWIGVPLMSFMYGIDFEQFRGLCYIMVVAGGVTAAIDFLYQAITVLRRQGSVTKLYIITFGFSLFVPILLINFTGLPGAVIGYLIVMTILLALLVMEYISIRIDLSGRLTGVKSSDFAATGQMPPVSRHRFDGAPAQGASVRQGSQTAAAARRRRPVSRSSVASAASALAQAAPLRSAKEAPEAQAAASAPASYPRPKATGGIEAAPVPVRPGGRRERLAREEAERRREEAARRAAEEQKEALDRQKKKKLREEAVAKAQTRRLKEREKEAFIEDTRELEGRRVFTTRHAGHHVARGTSSRSSQTTNRQRKQRH